MQLARRDYHDRSVAYVPARGAKERILKFRADRFQDGQRAVQVVARPAAGQVAQGKAREASGPGGVRDVTRRELPYPPCPADQDVQDAVDIHDLDQLGRAKLIEQVRDADLRTARVGRAGGAQRAGAHEALEPSLFPLELERRSSG
jgi:hypothetical protein